MLFNNVFNFFNYFIEILIPIAMSFKIFISIPNNIIRVSISFKKSIFAYILFCIS
ncbi:hypothetical protein BVAVS116_H0065 (plasmid) [Borreliella valaisiana VS116]|uniref:Uncharacterized protein n=1 Tax=Borreliella valaisiana VS116 TaxID=445987 RepID=C0R9C2_BORVA|nr:hypothetical protein BVAVS116_H0065 [Borreliella valaisiana VS116]